MGQEVQALYRLQMNPTTEIVDDFISDAEVMKEC